MRSPFGAVACSVLALHVSVAAAIAGEVLSPEIRRAVSGQLVWSDGSGGATTRARDETTNKDFSSETGVKLHADFNPDMTKFFVAEDSGAEIPWSLVEFPAKGDYLRARDAGYLEKLDPRVVDTSKLESGSFDDFGVDVLRYAAILAYNTKKYTPDTAPKSLTDIFDLKRFPGKRCMFKYPEYGAVLETALLADGVPKEKLYPLDVDRALKKLDMIKSDIVWWSNGDDSIRLIVNDECAIGLAPSGRVFAAVKNDKAPLAAVWKDAIYAQAVYAVPKGAPNSAAGQAMIAHFISDLEGQKAFVSRIPYVTGITALKPSDYPADVQPWIVAGDNIKAAIKEDGAFYSKNLPTLLDRFNRWVVMN